MRSLPAHTQISVALERRVPPQARHPRRTRRRTSSHDMRTVPDPPLPRVASGTGACSDAFRCFPDGVPRQLLYCHAADFGRYHASIWSTRSSTPPTRACERASAVQTLRRSRVNPVLRTAPVLRPPPEQPLLCGVHGRSYVLSFGGPGAFTSNSLSAAHTGAPLEHCCPSLMLLHVFQMGTEQRGGWVVGGRATGAQPDHVVREPKQATRSAVQRVGSCVEL
jgi:hypothetical protein